jgi:hypothetical protein
MKAAFARVGLLAMAAAAPAAGEPAALAALLAQVGQYVRGFQQDFATVLSDESYLQHETYSERISGRDKVSRAERAMQSEMLLLWMPEEREWLAVRNVLSVDRRPAADSRARLEQWLAHSEPGAMGRLRNLRDESARFNIGRLTRHRAAEIRERPTWGCCRSSSRPRSSPGRSPAAIAASRSPRCRPRISRGPRTPRPSSSSRHGDRVHAGRTARRRRRLDGRARHDGRLHRADARAPPGRRDALQRHRRRRVAERDGRRAQLLLSVRTDQAVRRGDPEVALPTHDAFVRKYGTAVDALVENGYWLPAEAAAAKQAAQESAIGR